MSKKKMEKLINDISTYLETNNSIRGFTRERINELLAGSLKGITGYELRFLILWSDLYVYQFEELYNLKVDTL
jgi:hypothetical protein